MPNVVLDLVYVENVAASEAFYASILGRPNRILPATFAMLPAAPGLMLGLWRREASSRRRDAAGGGEIAFPVEGAGEVDALFAEWVAQGVKIGRVDKMDFGDTFVGLDPNGWLCGSSRRPRAEWCT